MSAPTCKSKTDLFKQVVDIEKTDLLDVINDGNQNAGFNEQGTTHQRRTEMLLILILEVLVDIREGSTNPS